MSGTPPLEKAVKDKKLENRNYFIYQSSLMTNSIADYKEFLKNGTTSGASETETTELAQLDSDAEDGAQSWISDQFVKTFPKFLYKIVIVGQFQWITTHIAGTLPLLFHPVFLFYSLQNDT